jgi:hypothetical protein
MCKNEQQHLRQFKEDIHHDTGELSNEQIRPGEIDVIHIGRYVPANGCFFKNGRKTN